jgi:hypothetical protein
MNRRTTSGPVDTVNVTDAVLPAGAESGTLLVAVSENVIVVTRSEDAKSDVALTVSAAKRASRVIIEPRSPG